MAAAQLAQLRQIFLRWIDDPTGVAYRLDHNSGYGLGTLQFDDIFNQAGTGELAAGVLLAKGTAVTSGWEDVYETGGQGFSHGFATGQSGRRKRTQRIPMPGLIP